MGRGEKGLLSDLGSELSLAREGKEKSAKITDGTSKKKQKSVGECGVFESRKIN